MKVSKQYCRAKLIGLVVATGGVLGISASPIFAQDAQPKSARRSTDPPMMSKGKLCQDLFLAIDHRDSAQVKSLLNQGADPNSQNGLEFSPLYVAAASHQNDVVKLLLDSGAKADIETTYGSALTFAAATANVEGAKLLLGNGANVNMARTDGLTVLMMAATSGSDAMVKELIDAKANVLTTNLLGETVLTYAARTGNAKMGQILLETGLSPDRANNEGETPLMAAAQQGRTDFVKLLLENGADVNRKDNQGRTPLILAAKYTDNGEVAKALVSAGADAKVLDKSGRTASDFASARKHLAIAAVLGKSAKGGSVPTAHDATVKSMALIQSSMKTFNKGTACISCHQEGLGRMTTALAKQKGLMIDEEVAGAVQGRVGGAIGFLKGLHVQALKSQEAMKNLPLIEINELNTGYVWMLAGLVANNLKPEGAAEMADVLAMQQAPQGFWSFSMPRTPMQSSLFTVTALAVRNLNVLGSDNADKTARTKKAVSWMASTPAVSNEDKTFKLLGLKWGNADAKDMASAAKALAAGQQADGGWAQETGMESDAYATGQALYALHTAGGMKVSDPVYQKGVAYLLRHQDADGSWFVAKRALPANNYFDGGFPHGESQYSSFNGTCWATLALLCTLPG